MKRLIHFQSVGHSNVDPSTGRISNRVFDPNGQGWLPLITRTLVPLLTKTGVGNMDVWMHNTGGVWDDPSVSGDTNGPMLFHQWDIARERMPGLLDMSILKRFSDMQGIDLYGYIGYPLSDHKAPRNFNRHPYRPEHSDKNKLSLYYGPFVKHGFKGVGHDWSTHWDVGDAWENNVKWLKERNIEPFIEALPLKGSSHLLNYSCVGAEWIWEASEETGQERFYVENDILGTSVHLVLNPKRSDPVLDDPNYDPVLWRYDTANRLLSEGKHVAVPLAGFWNMSGAIEELAELAKD